MGKMLMPTVTIPMTRTKPVQQPPLHWCHPHRTRVQPRDPNQTPHHLRPPRGVNPQHPSPNINNNLGANSLTNHNNNKINNKQ